MNPEPEEFVNSYVRATLIDRREGKVVFFGSLAYLLVWAFHSFKPALLPIPPFYALTSPFIPIALVLTYVKIGGFKRKGFESGWFNTGILIVVLLAPFLVSAWAAIRR